MIIAIEEGEGKQKDRIKGERLPVQTMKGLVNFHMDESEELVDMERNLMSAKRIINHMGSQINELIEYTKIEKDQERLKKQPFSTDEFRKQVEFLIQPLCEDKALSYEIDFSGMEDVTFMTDKGLLVQMLWQLLDNAAQYTEEGGHITFQAYTVEKMPKEVTNCFVVKDNGIGMSKQFQKYLFQPFMRENNRMTKQVEGTGLGLYIVSQIVKLMHGEIQVESEEDKGSSVTIKLTSPLCNIMHEGQAKNLGDLSILQNKRVILCEENPKNEEQTRRSLEKVGVLVEVAKDGYEVVEMFEQSSPFYYDAILINVRMTALNGFEITNRIRQLDRDDAYLIPIIALIVDTYDENIAKPIDGGMDAQIAEPVEIGELLKPLAKFWEKYKE